MLNILLPANTAQSYTYLSVICEVLHIQTPSLLRFKPAVQRFVDTLLDRFPQDDLLEIRIPSPFTYNYFFSISVQSHANTSSHGAIMFWA